MVILTVGNITEKKEKKREKVLKEEKCQSCVQSSCQKNSCPLTSFVFRNKIIINKNFTMIWKHLESIEYFYIIGPSEVRAHKFCACAGGHSGH